MNVGIECARELRQKIEDGARRLLAISAERAAIPLGPGKWSRKEVVGHLIDSASNNHQRFVRAQFTSDLVFPGYDQDAWVRVQRYQERPWSELVEQCRVMNLHLAHVMDSIPDEVRMRKRMPHNLHELAWRTVPADRPVTLQYFLEDYVGHLGHHLDQALRGD
jgi:hypothetical protein